MTHGSGSQGRARGVCSMNVSPSAPGHSVPLQRTVCKSGWKGLGAGPLHQAQSAHLGSPRPAPPRAGDAALSGRGLSLPLGPTRTLSGDYVSSVSLLCRGTNTTQAPPEGPSPEVTGGSDELPSLQALPKLPRAPWMSGAPPSPSAVLPTFPEVPPPQGEGRGRRETCVLGRGPKGRG